MHVVFVASEAVPFAKTGGLADVAGALPRALENQGHSGGPVHARAIDGSGRPVPSWSTRG